MTALMSMFAFVSMIGAIFGEHVVLLLVRCCRIALRLAEDSSSLLSMRCRYEPHKWMGVITCECGEMTDAHCMGVHINLSCYRCVANLYGVRQRHTLT